MKLNSMASLVFTVAMLSVLLTAASTAPVFDQTRPNVIFRNTFQYYNNELVKGNTTETDVDLLLNKAEYTHVRDTVRGDPAVTQTAENITVTGNVLVTRVTGVLQVISGIQFDSYLPSQPVNQRFSVQPISYLNTESVILPIDNTQELGFSYNSLQSNNQFREIVREELDATAFVSRSGVLRTATINDSTGTPTVEVAGFALDLIIVIYRTSSQELLGLHRETIAGVGSIFPTRVANYLNNANYTNQLGDRIAERTGLTGDPSINWYYHGHNSSLGLDLYSAQFRMVRQATTLLLSDESGLQLSSVSLGLETFMFELEEGNTLSIDEDFVEDYDDAVVDDVIEQETSGLSTSESGDGVSEDNALPLNTFAILAGQMIALVILGNVLYKRTR